MDSADTTIVMSDQKKRALDAIERRFALKKETEQRNQIIRERFSRQKQSNDGVKTDAQSKKGNASFFPNSSFQVCHKDSDEQNEHPAYNKLSDKVDEKLIKPNVERHSTVGSVNKILHDLLQNGDFSQNYTKASRGMKIDNYISLYNFVPNKLSAASARAKVLQSHSKRSKKRMTMKQHKKHGLFDLPREFHNFNLFKPIHEMWKDYISKLLKESGRNQIPQHLLAADLHGAILIVVECKTTEFAGIHGIMVRETAETFGIITEEDKFRVVPKKGSVFIFQADSWKITLYGDKLSMRKVVL